MMPPPPQTPTQAAEALFAMLPHALSRETLEEYGIEATPEQTQQITREMLSVSLYWAHAALKTSLSRRDMERIFGALQQRILQAWNSDLGLDGHDPQAFFVEAEGRRKTYDAIVQDGGSPVAVMTETAAILESDSAVRPEDQQKVLALFLDLVPVDGIGVEVQQIGLTDR
jgi:hypothetical protein